MSTVRGNTMNRPFAMGVRPSEGSAASREAGKNSQVENAQVSNSQSAAAPALAVRAIAAEASIARRIAFAAVRALAGAAIAVGVLWGLAGLCGLDAPLAAIAGLALVGALAASASALHPRAALIAPLAIVAVCIAAALASGGGFAEGVRALWTSFASALADASDWRLPELALADPQSRATTATGLLTMLAFPTGALFAALAGLRRCWWLVLLAPFPLFCILSGGLALPAASCAVVAAGAAAAVGAAAGGRAAGAASAVALSADQKTPMRAASAAVIAACALAGMGVLALVVPPDSWQQPQPFAVLRDAGGSAIHGLRYGTQPNALTSGDFSSLGAWTAADGEIALTLETDGAPEPMYLRGFVGAEHDTTGWHTQTPAAYHESDALFWWLGDDGFSPMAQLGTALSASLGDEEAARQLSAANVGSDADASVANSLSALASAQPQHTAVENRAASSEWLYLPYGLDALDDEPALSDRAGETAASSALFGQRSYGFTSRAGLETAYPDVAALAWIARDPDADYWRDESNYNAYAYAHYAKNSDADEAAVTAVLGSAPDGATAHVDYAAAATSVVTWLSENVTYDESYGLAEGRTDVLADVLSGEKRGWSVHYATAAVAMLRHYGIPARYVEGYIVKPSDIEAAGAGALGAGSGAAAATGASGATVATAIEVPAANGHAWAEMYVDGTGWVPVETVPAVRAVMPQPDWARGIQADTTQRAASPPYQQKVQEEEVDAMAEALQQALAGLGWALLFLLIAFDLFALVFFLVSLIARLLARRRRRIAFSDPDDARAVCSMAAWMADIARYRFPRIAAGDARALEAAVAGAYGDEAASTWAAAQAIGRKAAFSTHGATPEERARVAHSADDFAQAVGRAEGVHERWMMKYIERLM